MYFYSVVARLGSSRGVSDFTGQSLLNYTEQENSSSCSFMKTSFWMEQRDLKQNLMQVIFFHILLFRSRYVVTGQSVIVVGSHKHLWYFFSREDLSRIVFERKK